MANDVPPSSNGTPAEDPATNPDLSEKEALALVVAEIDEVIPWVEAHLEKLLGWGGYGPFSRRLNVIVERALDASCLELPGGPFGDGLTSLPIHELKEGIVISPREFTLWKGRMLKLRREAEQRLNAIELVGPLEAETNNEGDEFSELLVYAAKNLSAKRRRVVEVVCDSGGSIPMKDLSVRMEWGSEWKAAWDGAKREINKKLEKARLSYYLRQKDNRAELISGPKPMSEASKKTPI